MGINTRRFSAVGGEATRLERGTEGGQTTGFCRSAEGSKGRGVGNVHPHPATECPATGILSTTFGVHRTMTTESFPFSITILFETVEESAAFAIFVFVVAGIGRQTDPRSSVVLDSPIAPEKMPSLRLLMRATDEHYCQQNGNHGNNFWGE